ncbi:hypothetical protein ACVWXN_006666 [Bradyrhizobium sp. i1.4.4]
MARVTLGKSRCGKSACAICEGESQMAELLDPDPKRSKLVYRAGIDRSQMASLEAKIPTIDHQDAARSFVQITCSASKRARQCGRPPPARRRPRSQRTICRRPRATGASSPTGTLPGAVGRLAVSKLTTFGTAGQGLRPDNDAVALSALFEKNTSPQRNAGELTQTTGLHQAVILTAGSARPVLNVARNRD